MPLLCIASPKGGVGKTTLAASLAHAFARDGRRVLALDLDPQNALRLHLGVPLDDAGGILADPANMPDWRDAVRMTPGGIALLPYGRTDLRRSLNAATALQADPELLAGPVRAMLADPDRLVIADLPPGPSPALAALAPLAKLVLVVLLADAGSAALLPQVEGGQFLGRGTLAGLVGGKLRFAINQVEPDHPVGEAAFQTLAGLLGPRLVGAVARDPAVAEALACQVPLATHAPQSLAAQDVDALAAELVPLLPEAGADPRFVNTPTRLAR